MCFLTRADGLLRTDTALFTCFFKIYHHKDWGIPVSPPGRQLPLECVGECTCVYLPTALWANHNAQTPSPCRAGINMSRVLGSTSSHWQQQLEDTAVTGVRASVVPLRFIKNTELTEQTHSGWMSLTQTHTNVQHIHPPWLFHFFIFCFQESFSNEKQMLWICLLRLFVNAVVRL